MMNGIWWVVVQSSLLISQWLWISMPWWIEFIDIRLWFNSQYQIILEIKSSDLKVLNRIEQYLRLPRMKNYASIFLTCSTTKGRFCLYNLSLYNSTMSVHFARAFLTLGRVASGGQEQNWSSNGRTGLLSDSASFKSLIQLSLCMYFGVIQQTTRDELRMLCWILLAGIVSLLWWTDCRLTDDRVLRLLCPRRRAPRSERHL